MIALSLHPETVEAPVAACSAVTGTLSGILHLLQNLGEPSLADAGLARFESRRLDHLQHLAQQQAGHCLDRLDVLTELLEDSLGSAEPAEAGLLLRSVQQLRLSLGDYRRWLALADNAGYYRDAPETRARIASLL